MQMAIAISPSWKSTHPSVVFLADALCLAMLVGRLSLGYDLHFCLPVGLANYSKVDEKAHALPALQRHPPDKARSEVAIPRAFFESLWLG
jgi:hypothetical protein